MANQNLNYTATSYSSMSYSSSSSTSSSHNPQDNSTSSRAQRYTETMHSNDRDGTTIRRTVEDSDRPTVTTEDRYIPSSSRGGAGSSSSSVEQAGGERGRIEDVTDRDDDVDEEQAARDREYEERMEEEYAKREGGA